MASKGVAPLTQIAKDFGLSVTTSKRFIATGERNESVTAATVGTESAEMRELKNRNQLLEQENEAAPNELCLTDITEHPTAEGKL